jgi:hypothetical protein
MQFTARLFPLNIFLVALLYGSCGAGSPNSNLVPQPSLPLAQSTPPARLAVVTEEEVTFYPTFGYKDARGWNLSLRGWVHEQRHGEERLQAVFPGCKTEERAIFKARTTDFLDEGKRHERVIIKFDSDPEGKSYENSERSGSDGIVTINLLFTDEQVKQLFEKQGSANGWLTYRAVSGDHTGIGRVKLIEPNGESLISDIDDTIKITQVPAAKKIVLRNTFCLDFKSVTEPDMAKMYKDLGDTPIHYVSGGPEQLFGPLYDYLIMGAGGFPEGTFHLKFFGESVEGLRTIIEAVKSSMKVTYEHKLEKIQMLMDKFPNRKFTLVGDSGEVDPEVYAEIRKLRPSQVKEIIIRDVINDRVVNPFRLDGMTIIEVDPPICAEDKHFEDVKQRVEERYRGKTYKQNTAPPCGP